MKEIDIEVKRELSKVLRELGVRSDIPSLIDDWSEVSASRGTLLALQTRYKKLTANKDEPTT